MQRNQISSCCYTSTYVFLFSCICLPFSFFRVLPFVFVIFVVSTFSMFVFYRTKYDQATHKCILYIIKYVIDEMCFLCFYIYIYLLLLIDVATVSRGHLFWQFQIYWKAPTIAHAHSIALFLRTKDHYHFHFIIHCFLKSLH